mmetsp:Transcript_9264/g.28544  ORF Transcript_9264/g.28544 Transcript_9264/m.28544 type:complete len:239 (-) Transcript_9264:1149-1865(-)
MRSDAKIRGTSLSSLSRPTASLNIEPSDFHALESLQIHSGALATKVVHDLLREGKDGALVNTASPSTSCILLREPTPCADLNRRRLEHTQTCPARERPSDNANCIRRVHSARFCNRPERHSVQEVSLLHPSSSRSAARGRRAGDAGSPCCRGARSPGQATCRSAQPCGHRRRSRRPPAGRAPPPARPGSRRRRRRGARPPCPCSGTACPPSPGRSRRRIATRTRSDQRPSSSDPPTLP